MASVEVQKYKFLLSHYTISHYPTDLSFEKLQLWLSHSDDSLHGDVITYKATYNFQWRLFLFTYLFDVFSWFFSLSTDVSSSILLEHIKRMRSSNSAFQVYGFSYLLIQQRML